MFCFGNHVAMLDRLQVFETAKPGALGPVRRGVRRGSDLLLAGVA